MSNPLMEKMLDLPEFEVTDFKQNDNDMGFYVETKKRPTFCHFTDLEREYQISDTTCIFIVVLRPHVFSAQALHQNSLSFSFHLISRILRMLSMIFCGVLSPVLILQMYLQSQNIPVSSATRCANSVLVIRFRISAISIFTPNGVSCFIFSPAYLM